MGKFISLRGGRGLDLSGRALVMGIINCTPDSFYQHSRQPTSVSAIETARKMIDQGADILDLGGESSRPGSEYVSAEVELDRVLPVLRELRKESPIPVSIDTRKAEVARAALDEGADMINDISALQDDPGLLALVAERNVPVILMHMKGTPRTMQSTPVYGDTVREVADALISFADRARKAGLSAERIILDPGIGFGKRLSDNLLLIRDLGSLCALGYPILVGISRKSFIGMVLKDELGEQLPPERRLTGTIAANAAAISAGASIVRVHDVREAVELSRMMWAISTSVSGAA